MDKRFLVIGNWISKETGKPMSGIAEISSGVNKNGQRYEIAATDRREAPIEGTFPVGAILSATTTLTAQADTSKGGFGDKVSK